MLNSCMFMKIVFFISGTVLYLPHTFPEMLSKLIGPNFEAQADLIEHSNNLEFFYKLLADSNFKIGPRK